MSTPFEFIEANDKPIAFLPISDGFVEGNRLIERWQTLTTPVFVIGETGFGAGLNFLLAWSIWEKVAPPNAKLYVMCSEKHPLTLEALQKSLAPHTSLAPFAEALIAAYPVLTTGCHRLHFANHRVTLDLMLGDAHRLYQDRLLCGDSTLEHALRQDTVDAWIFSPIKASEKQLSELCLTLFQLSNPDTTLVSLSTDAVINQALHTAGFRMADQAWVRGELTSHQSTHQRRISPWHVGPPRHTKAKTALVIGAGLAGCMMAHQLANRGWRVSLLDERSTIAQGASGNQRSILFPNLSAYHAPLTELMLAAFLYAARFYREAIPHSETSQFSGILQLVRGKKTNQTQADLAAMLAHYPELGRWVDPMMASDIAGVAVSSEAIYIPLACWLNTPALCEHLIQHPQIDFFPNTAVSQLEQDNNGSWQIDNHTAAVAVITNGFAANQFKQTAYLEIKALRGQMTTVGASHLSQKLCLPLCGEGHILPATAGEHAIGATFGLYSEDAQCQSDDDVANLAKINALAANVSLPNQVVSSWAGVRGAALDHLPLVGPVADAKRFVETFTGFQSNSKRWIPESGCVYDGLYIAAGFGARGVTTIPLCTEYLASLINHEPLPLSQPLARAISPARFLYRGIVRG